MGFPYIHIVESCGRFSSPDKNQISVTAKVVAHKWSGEWDPFYFPIVFRLFPMFLFHKIWLRKENLECIQSSSEQQKPLQNWVGRMDTFLFSDVFFFLNIFLLFLSHTFAKCDFG